MLKQRFITAVVLVVVLAWAVFAWPNSYFALLVLFVSGAAAQEWAALQRLSGARSWVAVLCITALCAFAVFVLDGAVLVWLARCVAVAWVVLTAWLVWSDKHGLPNQPTKWSGALSLPLLAVAASLLVALHATGAWILLYVLAIAWAADIGAYFAGKRFGRVKLAPTVSPGKSVEGFLGGLVAVFVLSLISLSAFDLAAAQPLLWVSASLIAAVFSVSGDLFESTMKRAAGVKDSGWILPGHGGVLDRIDSLLASIPVFVALVPSVLA